MKLSKILKPVGLIFVLLGMMSEPCWADWVTSGSYDFPGTSTIDQYDTSSVKVSGSILQVLVREVYVNQTNSTLDDSGYQKQIFESYVTATLYSFNCADPKKGSQYLYDEGRWQSISEYTNFLRQRGSATRGYDETVAREEETLFVLKTRAYCALLHPYY